ncbi:metallophosphoesterase family protein [Candidatus Woesearchaeota archaeon]|nr:metallophosphoesterase family protein [Candidatus Woesearchaeota archaeon]
MNILAFTDLHGSETAWASLAKKAPKADIIICAGDLTIFEQDLEQWLRRLSRLKKKVLIIPGNHESPRSLKIACKGFDKIIYLHKHAIIVKDHLFMGFAGNGFVMDEPGLRKTAKAFKILMDEHRNLKKVFIIHPPPFQTTLDVLNGDCVGNRTLRDFIEEVDLNLVICGHIHENAGKQDRIKKTTIINPGPKGKLIRIK